MLRIFIVLLFSAVVAVSEDIYVAQNATGADDGTSCSAAKSLAWATNVSNWGSGANKIGAGDTLHLCGTLTNELTVQGSGSVGNVITILFEVGAKFSAPTYPGNDASGAIRLVQKDHITIDGGVNGVIECTANGTGLTYQQFNDGVVGVSCNYLTVKNLTVKNLYVRMAGVEQVESGTGIRNTDDGGPAWRDFTVTNCVIEDAYSGIYATWGASGASNVIWASNVVSNCNWGMAMGDTAAGNMRNVRVFQNNISRFSNWDDTLANNYHHNGFFVFSTAGIATDIECYGNTIGPGFGTYATSGIYFASNVRLVSAYNNLFLADSGDAPNNGFITCLPYSDSATMFRCMNNTVAGGGVGIGVYVNYTATATANKTNFIQNNLFHDVGTAIALFTVGLASDQIDYNWGYSLGAGTQYSRSTNGTANFITLAEWQSPGYGSHDVHGTNLNPNLTASYTLHPASPAINAGTNLSAFFATDKNGNARSGAWDIGAFELAPVASTFVLGIGTNAVPVSLNTAAELRVAPTNVGAIQTSGYYSRGDGGGGTFVWVPGDATAVNFGSAWNRTGATGRWMETGKGPVNLLLFGADPTGTLDSTTNIQAAIDFANVTKRTVYVPAATNYYRVTGLVTGYSDTIYYGDGVASQIRQFGDNLNVFKFSGKTNSIVRGLHLRPKGDYGALSEIDAAFSGLSIRDSSRITVEDCTFTGSPYAALMVYRSDYITIRKNSFPEAGWVDPYVWQSQVSDVVLIDSSHCIIKDNTMYSRGTNSGDNGILVFGGYGELVLGEGERDSTDILIQDNKVKRKTQYGIISYAFTNFSVFRSTVKGNTVEDIDGSYHHVDEGTNYSGITSGTAAGTGIYMQNSLDSSVDGNNQVYRCGLFTRAGGTLIKSSISGAGTPGISVHGNRIEEGYFRGIYVNNSGSFGDTNRHPKITANHLSNCGVYAATGNITSGTNRITLAVPTLPLARAETNRALGGFWIGDKILVIGAGAANVDLEAVVTAISGSALILDVNASVTTNGTTLVLSELSASPPSARAAIEVGSCNGPLISGNVIYKERRLEVGRSRGIDVIGASTAIPIFNANIVGNEITGGYDAIRISKVRSANIVANEIYSFLVNGINAVDSVLYTVISANNVYAAGISGPGFASGEAGINVWATSSQVVNNIVRGGYSSFNVRGDDVLLQGNISVLPVASSYTNQLPQIFVATNSFVGLNTTNPLAQLQIKTSANHEIQVGATEGVYGNSTFFTDLVVFNNGLNFSRTSDGTFTESVFGYDDAGLSNLGFSARGGIKFVVGATPNLGMRLAPTGNLTISGTVTVAGTTNQIVFGATNLPPVVVAAPTKWVSVQINGESVIYRLPLYQ